MVPGRRYTCPGLNECERRFTNTCSMFYVSMAIGSESIRITSLRLSVRKNERIICTYLIRALFKQVLAIYKFIPTFTLADVC